MINEAKVYAEGRGFSFEFKNTAALEDVKTLIDIKLSN
ncbi:MAG: hypothetical protein JEZ09_15095 [Salinivirgaceae bacterium]|nr:hypothetical protein [Salinivirgaceae bacterium]